MVRFSTWLIFASSIMIFAQQPGPDASQGSDAMVAAVLRNKPAKADDVGSGSPQLTPEKVNVEPLAWLTPSGEWKSIGCDAEHQVGCSKFEREYLKIPHNYTVISAVGRGAVIQAEPTALSDPKVDCLSYMGPGQALAFPLLTRQSLPVQHGYSPLALLQDGLQVGRRTDSQGIYGSCCRELDPPKELSVYSTRMEGQNLFVVQRAVEDQNIGYIFAIGRMSQGRFDLLSWQNRINSDENESILGTIHMKNNRDFLITTISDPETQFFRVYGIQKGKLTLVYAGGGGGC